MNREAQYSPNDSARVSAAPDIASDWVDWGRRLMAHNELPFSGNVAQWIRAWGEAVGQVGLFNVNMAGSRDPDMERTITSKISYGRQLGRILDVLTPMVKEFDPNRLDPEKRKDFLDMEQEIQALKLGKLVTISEIVDAVKRWEEQSPSTYRGDLNDLLDRLGQL